MYKLMISFGCDIDNNTIDVLFKKITHHQNKDMKEKILIDFPCFVLFTLELF